MRVPFSPPRIDQKIVDEVSKTLLSGWISTGPKTKEFEKQLTQYNGNKTTLCLNSATAGLELILRWFGVGAGDEVILPAYTYSATANVIIHCGATPVFVDVNAHDFNINLAAIEKAINPKTKVIMPVDFAGLPCDYNAINELAKKYHSIFVAETETQKTLGRILVLSDAAHSIGGIYHGKKTGSLTDVSVFSFHAVKNLTTSEGGAIAFNLPEPFDNAAVYQQLNITSLHGQNKDALAKLQKGNWKYDIIEAGYKCNMTDITASIGLVELERYDNDMLVKRKSIFELYNRILSGYQWIKLPIWKDDHRCSSFHLYPIRITGITETQRDAIMQEIFNQDIAVNVHFIPVPRLSYYQKLGYKIEDYPTAYKNFVEEITLPVFYNLTEEQVYWVCDALAVAYKKVIG